MQYGPGLAPIPRVQLQAGLDMLWTGWDGSQWHLTDYSGKSGIVLMPDFVGLEMPDFTLFTSTSDSRHGAIRRGYKTNPRTVNWNLLIYNDTSSADWVRYQSQFLDTMHPDMPGIWQVRAPGSEARTLVCHLSKMAPGYTNDPAWQQWSITVLELIADDVPFWQGQPVVKPWRSFIPMKWMARPGQQVKGVWNINPNAIASSAFITNPGDVEGWIKWQASGPIDAGMVLGVGDPADSRSVTIPFPVKASDSLTIDTDPLSQVVMLNGKDVTNQLTTRPRFAPVAPGAEMPLTVTMSGTGQVTGTLVPRYFRAW